jgi:hypothetical protein
MTRCDSRSQRKRSPRVREGLGSQIKQTLGAFVDDNSLPFKAFRSKDRERKCNLINELERSPIPAALWPQPQPLAVHTFTGDDWAVIFPGVQRSGRAGLEVAI